MKPDPDAALDYLEFVAERHRIWEKRQLGLPAPWTEDPVLASKKFTNVFRVLDYGTQFLLTELLAEGSLEDRIFRCILYRYTNRPEPWLWFFHHWGWYPRMSDVDRNLPQCWHEYRMQDRPMFGQAYRSGYVPPGTDRLELVLSAAQTTFRAAAMNCAYATSQREMFGILKELPRGGPFMAMQIVTDIGYTPEVASDENEFVVPGPGAANGLRLVFPDAPPQAFPELLRMVAEEWLPNYPGSPVLRLPGGIDRRPSLMDVQSTFCEYSKYVRPLRSDKPYQPSHPGHQPTPTYPSHWFQ